jgi:hypothetical protein
MRLLIGSAVALIAVLFLADSIAYRGQYRNAAWHEIQARTGLLQKPKTDHSRRPAHHVKSS